MVRHLTHQSRSCWYKPHARNNATCHAFQPGTTQHACAVSKLCSHTTSSTHTRSLRIQESVMAHQFPWSQSKRQQNSSDLGTKSAHSQQVQHTFPVFTSFLAPTPRIASTDNTPFLCVRTCPSKHNTHSSCVFIILAQLWRSRLTWAATAWPTGQSWDRGVGPFRAWRSLVRWALAVCGRTSVKAAAPHSLIHKFVYILNCYRYTIIIYVIIIIYYYVIIIYVVIIILCYNVM